MDIESIIDRVCNSVAEVVTVDDLRSVFETVSSPKGYIGFEPSGLIHIGWLIWMSKVKDLVDAGVDFYVLEATWHAYINDKLGGDIELIRKAARFTRKIMEYFGIEISRVKFIDAEELVSDKEYWSILLRIAKKTTLARVKRALTIMGRRASEAETDFSKLIYPLMQVSDIFYLDLDIALGGMDQRKAHMLARDLAEYFNFKKPVAIHTPILTSLQGPGEIKADEQIDIDDIQLEFKMSKSKPETCIFIHDEPGVIKNKIRKAYCPPRETRFNPIVEINKYLLFRKKDFKLFIERPAKYGGSLEITSYDKLEKMYSSGEIHPLDLKNATAEALVQYLDPIRSRLMNDRETVELLNILSSAKITR